MGFRFTVDVDAGTFDEAEQLASRVRTMAAAAPWPVTVSEVSRKPDAIEIYTDGGYDRNTDTGAWACLIRRPGRPDAVSSGAFAQTTNNRMEMMAVIQALDSLPAGTVMSVYSDSQYVIKGSTLWLQGWKRNGWRTADGKPVLNQDLWYRIDAHVCASNIRWKHVRGHSGHRENEACDKQCSELIAKAKLYRSKGGSIPLDVRQ